MSTPRIMKWITCGLEALLAIPIIGGTIVIGFYYTPLIVMLALHIVTLILTKSEGRGPASGSIVGIITSCIAWIPFLGWFMHLLTAIILLINAVIPDKKVA